MASDRALPGPNDLQAWDRLCFGRCGDGGGGDGGDGGGDAAAAGAAAAGEEGEAEVEEDAAVPGSEVTFLSPAILPTLMALDQARARFPFCAAAARPRAGPAPRARRA
jgi:hypothetical protein